MDVGDCDQLAVVQASEDLNTSAGRMPGSQEEEVRFRSQLNEEEMEVELPSTSLKSGPTVASPQSSSANFQQSSRQEMHPNEALNDILLECVRLGIDISQISQTETVSAEETYRMRLEALVMAKKLEDLDLRISSQEKASMLRQISRNQEIIDLKEKVRNLEKAIQTKEEEEQEIVVPMESIRKGELHPLQNPNILQVIFKDLKLKDLNSCRLVCREWCRGSRAAMKQAAPVVRIRDENGKRVSNFLELVKVKEEDDDEEVEEEDDDEEEGVFSIPPFMKNFEVYSLAGDFPTFWEFCGSNIRSLHLSVVAFDSSHEFCDAIFDSCPNLEALSLYHVHAADGDGDEVEEPNHWTPPYYPINQNLKSLKIHAASLPCATWMEILAQFPGLETFEAYEMMDLQEFFNSLAFARRHNDQCWKIKHLSFSLGRISRVTNVEVLEDRNLHLESLKVTEINRPRDVITVQRILAAHAPTLKNLHLDGSDGTLLPVLNNLMFHNVTNLALFSDYLQSGHFLQSFPNVKKLSLECNEILPQFWEEPMGDWVLSSCTDLSCSIDYLKPEAIQRLISGLPKLEMLRVDGCSNAEFALICELLPNLTHLDIQWSSVDDTGISGLDKADVERINGEWEKGDCWWPISVSRPNLSGLKNLKQFEWTQSDEPQTMVPGYCAAQCIQLLPKLQHLRLPDGCTHDLIWNRLQDQYPLPSE